jgi:hypothetical protein
MMSSSLTLLYVPVLLTNLLKRDVNASGLIRKEEFITARQSLRASFEVIKAKKEEEKNLKELAEKEAAKELIIPETAPKALITLSNEVEKPVAEPSRKRISRGYQQDVIELSD